MKCPVCGQLGRFVRDWRTYCTRRKFVVRRCDNDACPGRYSYKATAMGDGADGQHRQGRVMWMHKV